MKTLVFSIFIAINILISAHIQPAQAQDFPVSEGSATLTLSQILSSEKEEIIKNQAKREAMIRVLTKYNSPLVAHVDSFIKTSEKYELEDYFLVSIAGVESTFAKRMIHGTHNPYGYGKGRIVFNSWEHGIDVVGSKLRESYINRGAETIDQIGPRYAGGSTTWASKVKHFMNEFRNEEQAILEVSYYLQG